MSRSIKIKKGFDIPVEGAAEKSISDAPVSKYYGIRPIDFPGLTPRLCVKTGDQVLAGAPLFHDKVRPEILFTSPVSGTVTAVERGDRRKMLEVIVERTGNESMEFGKVDPNSLSREKVKEKLLNAGLWPAVRQRPYHIVANPADTPKSVFISGFDTSPLAPDYNFIAENIQTDLLQAGIDAVSKFTDGKVNLVLDGRKEPSPVLADIKNVDISYFAGPHPAGNVGVHIHHLDPVNKGEVVWYVNFQDLVTIGRLFREGRYYPERIVAFTGSEAPERKYYRMIAGASIEPVVKSDNGKKRYISGNVLTGTRVNKDGFLGFYDAQISIIPEGDYFEFFGWASPGSGKLSYSRTFLSRLLPHRKFRPDTNMHGGERAFVMTGQYEKVVPMDIYPMQLFKSILAGDIDSMENLGIYEVAEEDFALCEFICPSKIEIQSIVRDGLNLMMKEMN
jgi:Na+-transporting NADH:ubiquinone oxidoreductase subunit A